MNRENGDRDADEEGAIVGVVRVATKKKGQVRLRSFDDWMYL